jgi:hypothetical protein
MILKKSLAKINELVQGIGTRDWYKGLVQGISTKNWCNELVQGLGARD